MSIFKTARIEQVLLSLFRSFHNAYLHNQASQHFWVFEGICLLFCQMCNRGKTLLNNIQ